MHSLKAQPSLSEAANCQRFKGCYLLDSVKVKITDSGCLLTLRHRIQFFQSKQEQSLCFDILKNFSHELSTYGLQNLCQQLAQLDENQLVVELVHQVEKQSDDIGSTGKLLDQLNNKLPYKIWEQKLLGL